ncbi:MAG TPA: hypothetical protein PLU79_13495 [Burkholderiaceae bacterium]|nr:hypothetical protein [Burkholderiaceae bacterium]
MLTDQQIRDFIQAQGIGDNPFAIYNYAQKYDVSPGEIDSAMGYAPGTSDAWIRQQGLKGLNGTAYGGTARTKTPVTDAQVRAFIQQQGIADNPHAIQAFAGQYGVTPGQIDSAMGYSPGSATGWQQSAGLTGQVPAGVYSAPAPAPPAPTGAVGLPQTQPAAQPGGFPSMGTYAMPTTQNMPWASPGAPTTSAPSATSGWAQPQQPFSLPSYNPYTEWMADSIGQRMGQHLQRNLLPGIRSGAASAGGLGGSRQGIAEGIAIGDTMTGYGNALAGLYSGQFNADRNYGLANDAMDLNVYNANQNWMRQGQQDQLGLADRLLGWNQQYGVGNATQVQNTPLNYWQQFSNSAGQMAGLGGSQSQNLQGNPWLGALGGAMTAGNLWGQWNGQGKPGG